MNERERKFTENASKLLGLWSAYVTSGGLDKPPAAVPDELLDLEDQVSSEVPALIGICMAIHAEEQECLPQWRAVFDGVGSHAARTILSLSAKLALKSPDAVMKIIPLATGLAKWAGAGKETLLRGMGCMTAMTLMRSGSAIAPSGTLKEMVRDGAVWSVLFPGSDPTPVGMATLGSALATHVFPEGDAWADFVGAPEPELFSGWAAYLYGGGLDKPVASVHFSLTGILGQGAQLVDAATSSVISAAICLAANDLGDDSTDLLKVTEMCVREAAGDIEKLLVILSERIGSFSQLSVKVGREESYGASGCLTALVLWQAGLMECLDPHHTLRRMAVSQDTRFAAKSKVYTIGEFSRMQGDVLRDMRRDDDAEDS